MKDYTKVSVKPIREIKVEDTINSLIEAGVSIYFVDDNVFNNLIRNSKQNELITKLNKFSH
jgi:hypothetical protein